MKPNKLLLAMLVCTVCTNLNAQISTNELPYSFIEENRLELQKTQTIESINVPLPVSTEALEKEDIIDGCNSNCRARSDEVLPRPIYPAGSTCVV
jgi:hypothetical protein